MKRLILLSLILVAHNLFSQNRKPGDYLVTVRDDTVKGSIRPFGFSDTEIYLMPSGANELKSYSIKDTKLLFTRDSYYYSVYVGGNDPLLLLLLVDGKIDLFRGEEKFYLRKDEEWFKLEKKDTIINNHYYEDKRYTGLLSALVKECEGLGNKTASVRFSAKELVKFIGHYNQCQGDTGSDSYKRVKSYKKVVEYGVKLGGSLGDLKASDIYYRLQNYKPQIGFSAGAYMSLFVSKKLLFRPELLITQKRSVFKETPSIPISSVRDLQDEHYDVIYAQLPLLFQYPLVNRKTVVYIFGGCLVGKGIAGSVRRVGLDRPDRNYKFRPIEYGAKGGIGVGFPFGNKWASAEYQYEIAMSNGNMLEEYRTMSHGIFLRIPF